MAEQWSHLSKWWWEEMCVYPLHCEYRITLWLILKGFNLHDGGGEHPRGTFVSVWPGVWQAVSRVDLRGLRMAASAALVVLVTGCLRRIPSAKTSSSCSEMCRTWRGWGQTGSSEHMVCGELRPTRLNTSEHVWTRPNWTLQMYSHPDS